MKYADIIIDRSLESLDRVFQYVIPEVMSEMISIGSQVMVPFGNGNRLIRGYVVGFSKETDYDPSKMKAIHEIKKDGMVVELDMLYLADWMHQTYGCTRAQALKTVLNVKRQVRGGTKKVYKLCVTPEKARQEMEKLAGQTRFASRAAILALLLDSPDNTGVSEIEIRKKVQSPESAIKTLMKNGWIDASETSNYRIPFSGVTSGRSVVLSAEQKAAVEGIWDDKRMVHLLYGVTGSGKTEVYMQLIERAISNGKQAIVLIPEISLTYQNIGRFRQRFGQRVSVMNSKMSEGERYDQYVQAKNGEIDILIGPRSALFAPFEHLGLIIIDEEHDGAYKSDVTPKYHAKDVAIKRMELCGGKVVLGSATPSVVSYDLAKQGIYGLHLLKERISGIQRMSDVEIVDLREELKQKNYSVFSRSLQNAIEDRLAKKEQILLFLNRRGYAGFVSCRSCGYVIRCPHCDVSLTLHKNGADTMVCHYCGWTIPAAKNCPECGSPYIGAFGMGTQKVVELLQKRFPSARILRADRDAFQRKNSYFETFQAFARGEADILVGTQMIVKGHDFPNVTLAGVLAADLSMFSGDYLSSERTFQLLTQAVGRAGRGDKPGLAIIQTYQPEHYAVTCAAAQDYENFYRQERLYRKMMKYPPFGGMMVAVCEHKDEMLVMEAANRLADIMRTEPVIVLPPTDAFRAKEKDLYRKVIYIKSKDEHLLHVCRENVQHEITKDELLKQMNIQFDMNPVHLY